VEVVLRECEAQPQSKDPYLPATSPQALLGIFHRRFQLLILEVAAEAIPNRFAGSGKD
jgi:hypothetical protein